MDHIVKRGEYLSLIAAKHKISLTKLLAANPRYKADPGSVDIGDKLVIPRAIKKKPKRKKTPTTRKNRTSTAPASIDNFTVPAGQLTFDAEGMEVEGKYFSRKPHVPGAWSGITIGRGYDMKDRSSDEIIEDLTTSGVSLTKARKFAACRGLMGAKARNFLAEKNYTDLTITAQQQKNLFTIIYEELSGDVKRICSKLDVVDKYGETDWVALNSLNRDIAVDLRYRGDYTGATRERVQPILVENDLAALTILMSDRDYWVGSRSVPVDRFNRRRDYLSTA
jgi:hypothetical protein|tara:strand:- start:8474 stop:9313 length:840 start_codon:yes stop_codon:yes gene_type:complete